MMTNDELNIFIKHYIEKDQTNRAIMLTGAWGIGKSYYVNNHLMPFLDESVDDNHQCIVVSLNGLSDVSEISKAIFFEVQFNAFKPKSKAVKNAACLAMAVFNGALSHFDVNSDESKREMEKIYKSVDLSDKLIILEDLERSDINILKILGYVNNLTEHNHVRVMLVMNEEEIIRYQPVDKSDEDAAITQASIGGITLSKINQQEKKYTEETEHYLREKEKTICDTIHYRGDVNSSIKDIITLFGNDMLIKYAEDKSVSDIIEIMKLKNSYNLRSFIFACQKAVDIYDAIGEESVSELFKQTVFYGIIAFSLRLRAGLDCRWPGGMEHYSQELGIATHPLFRFCYDYIMEQHLDLSTIKSAADALEKHHLQEQDGLIADSDWNCLSHYSVHTEEEVVTAVERIVKRLENPEDIPLNMYGQMAYFLASIKHDLQIDYLEKARPLLIDNLKGKGNIIDADDLFWISVDNGNVDIQRDYTHLREEMVMSLNNERVLAPGFNYLPEQIHDLRDYVKKNLGLYYKSRSFAKYLDTSRFVEMFYQCNPLQMDEVSHIFVDVYNTSDVKIVFRNDLETIQNLLDTFESPKEMPAIDKVQKFQIKRFIDYLRGLRDRLSVS